MAEPAEIVAKAIELNCTLATEDRVALDADESMALSLAVLATLAGRGYALAYYGPDPEGE